jgi:hypothetical protein
MDLVLGYILIGFALDMILVTHARTTKRDLNWKARAWFYLGWPLVVFLGTLTVVLNRRKK